MESVPPAIIVIFLILFAMFSFGGAAATLQDSVRLAWDESIAEQAGRLETRLVPVRGQVIESGSVIEYTLRNDGTSRLADFDDWDLIVTYYDAAAQPGYHITWLPFADDIRGPNTWLAEGIYADAETRNSETFEPGVLNPGEEIVLQAALVPPVGAHQLSQAVFVTPHGATSSLVVERDEPPVPVAAGPLRAASGQPWPVGSMVLLAEDADDEAASIVYTVLSAPRHGNLNLGHSFTQAAIDGASLTYTNDGDGALEDSFVYTVSNRTHTLGPFTCLIEVFFPPVLETNNGLAVLVGQPAPLTTSALRTTDADTPADQLIYTVTAEPAGGDLNMLTFTQADIDSGVVFYNGATAGIDSFTFSLTDGDVTIGPFTFSITSSGG